MPKTKLVWILLVALMFTVLTPLTTTAIDLGDILKTGAIGAAVDAFANPLNKFINTVASNKKVQNREMTKVVPIISLGSGGYVGAAQVIGRARLLDKVKAVAQIEADFHSFRAKVLIPVTSKKPLKDLKRVYGVGVSAVIDVKI